MIALTALVCAALFAGAAFPAYLTANRRGPDRAALAETALAVVGGVLGAVAWYRWQSNWFWLGGGVLLLGGAAATLVAQWNKHPALRLVLGLIAVGLIWYGLKPD